MSSKRGRKRNDTLPPNRARDVQRAFRARRAAHLQAMEKRVEELEEENTRLRAALNLPPANRAPLGKGPTGKDKPRNHSSMQPSSSSVPLASPLASTSGTTSAAESPASSRTSSLSPSAITASIRTPPSSIQPLDNGHNGWEQAMLLRGDERMEGHTSPASTTSVTFPLSAMSHKSQQQQFQFPPPSSLQSPSRQSAGNIYASANYSDRSLGAHDGTSYVMRDGRVDDSPSYAYSQSPFPSTSSAAHLQGHHSSLSESTTSLSAQSPYPQQRDSAGPGLPCLPFTHRRSITEPLGGFRNNVNSPFPNMVNNSSASNSAMQGIRLPSPPHLADGAQQAAAAAAAQANRTGHSFGNSGETARMS